MNLLSVEDLSIKYGDVTALASVSFTVSRGEYICIIGPNGSGKSSLIKAILDLVPIASGEIVYGIGKEKMAYMPQTNMAERSFPATVNEIVLLGMQKKGSGKCFYSKEDYAAAKESIAKMGIEDVAGKPISKLSGGQLQRAFLARALCKNPKLLILDEPCAGLDPSITEELYALLEKLNKNDGVTILMASHDLSGVEKNASRIIKLSKKIIFDGDVKDWKEGGFADSE